MCSGVMIITATMTACDVGHREDAGQRSPGAAVPAREPAERALLRHRGGGLDDPASRSAAAFRRAMSLATSSGSGRSDTNTTTSGRRRTIDDRQEEGPGQRVAAPSASARPARGTDEVRAEDGAERGGPQHQPDSARARRSGAARSAAAYLAW